MQFLFACLKTLSQPTGWLSHLMHLADTASVIAVFVCVLFALHLKGTGTQWKRNVVASIWGPLREFRLDHAD
jgi:hypothetical protein